MMNFDTIFETPATLGKQLEHRWYRNTEENPGSKTKFETLLQHRLPFLARNLAHVLGAIEKSSESITDCENEKRGDSQTGSKQRKTIDKWDNRVIKEPHRAKQSKGRSSSSMRNGKPTKINYRTKVKRESAHETSVESCGSLLLDFLKDDTKICYDSAGDKQIVFGAKKKADKNLLSQFSSIGVDGNSLQGIQLHQSSKKASSVQESSVESASAFGKAFPSYNPVRKGPPKSFSNAFELFCKNNARKISKGRSKINKRKKEDKKTKFEKMWRKLSRVEMLYWKQEEAWDRKRYRCQLKMYNKMLEAEASKDDSTLLCPDIVPHDVFVNAIKKDRTSVGSSNQAKLPQKAAFCKKASVTPRLSKKVFFHYLYMREVFKPSAQIEVIKGRRCPFCSYNARTDLGLVLHCRCSHHGLQFDSARDEDSHLHIAVRGNYEYENDADTRVDFIFSRPKSPFRNFDVALLENAERKKNDKSYAGTPKEQKSAILTSNAKIRQYYHSRTNLPMLDNDWLHDSDEENDDNWLQKMSEGALSEFDDVSVKEKAFMNIWNIFIKSHTIIPDRSIPSLTYKFAEMLSVFHAHNLRQNLLLHLFNLWDSSLVSSQHILLCMTTYDSTAPRIVHKKNLSPSCRMLEPSPSVGRSKLNSQTSPFRRSKKRILEGK